jgi:hypothetical protein
MYFINYMGNNTKENAREYIKKKYKNYKTDLIITSLIKLSLIFFIINLKNNPSYIVEMKY